MQSWNRRISSIAIWIASAPHQRQVGADGKPKRAAGADHDRRPATSDMDLQQYRKRSSRPLADHPAAVGSRLFDTGG